MHATDRHTVVAHLAPAAWLATTPLSSRSDTRSICDTPFRTSPRPLATASSSALATTLLPRCEDTRSLCDHAIPNLAAAARHGVLERARRAVRRVVVAAARRLAAAQAAHEIAARVDAPLGSGAASSRPSARTWEERR